MAKVEAWEPDGSCLHTMRFVPGSHEIGLWKYERCGYEFWNEWPTGKYREVWLPDPEDSCSPIRPAPDGWWEFEV